MRKLYNEFLRVPKDGKICEKVILTRMALAVVVIVACLLAMGISAYAYFSGSIVSSSSVIQAANFETLVSIQNLDSNESVDVAEADKITKSATLQAGKYSVKIEKLGSASTGFCVISTKNDGNVHYYTQQIGKDVSAQTEETSHITFTIIVTQPTTVYFTANWGTSPYYADYVENGTNDILYIIDGETIELQTSGENP